MVQIRRMWNNNTQQQDGAAAASPDGPAADNNWMQPCVMLHRLIGQCLQQMWYHHVLGKNTDWGCSRIGLWGTWRKRLMEKIAHLGMSWLVLVTKYYRGKQMEAEDWGGRVPGVWKKKFIGRVLVGKWEEKRPLGRPRNSWDHNTKMDLQEIGCDHMEWLNLARTGTSGKLMWA